MLRELKQEHHITYLTLDDGSADSNAREMASEYSHELICVPHSAREKFSAGFYGELAVNLISPLPYAIKKYESAEMRRLICERAAEFDLVVCDFLAPAINVPPQLACASLLFQHNVEAMIWKRHYEVQGNSVKRAYLRAQWRKMCKFERDTCREFDTVVAVSREDRDLMKQEYGLGAVYDIPTGVDTEYFKPSGTVKPKPFNIVFTGSMDWLPNEDAMKYFTEQILPIIKKAVPAVTLTVVGRNPYPGLLELSHRDLSIDVTGRVDDVRPYIEAAAAYIVPLRIGGGTRLKIYEAMAMAKPLVSTTIGAEGLPVRNGEELMLADTPEAFAGAVVNLLQDQSLADRLGQRAAARVREAFGWRRVAEDFASLCETTVNKA